jgi:hypothetical protein
MFVILGSFVSCFTYLLGSMFLCIHPPFLFSFFFMFALLLRFSWISVPSFALFSFQIFLEFILSRCFMLFSVYSLFCPLSFPCLIFCCLVSSIFAFCTYLFSFLYCYFPFILNLAFVLFLLLVCIPCLYLLVFSHPISVVLCSGTSDVLASQYRMQVLCVPVE